MIINNLIYYKVIIITTTTIIIINIIIYQVRAFESFLAQRRNKIWVSFMLLNNGCDHFQKYFFLYAPFSLHTKKKYTGHFVFLVYSVPLLFGVYPTQAVDLLCAGMFCVGSSADSLCNVSLYFPAVGFGRELHRWRSF